ncbi:MAG: hypothetical protein GTO40_24090 [Deltaproteobacteria bacterium]|nr:hypothetical protein [Deltaproteobacteria bacterium]
MLPEKRKLEVMEESPVVVANKRSGAKRKIRSVAELKDDLREDTSPSSVLPDDSQLEDLLGLRTGSLPFHLMGPVLLEPIRYLTECPGKKIRGHLVRLGYELARSDRPITPADRKRCRLGAEVLELIHAGSLVADDIEDGSKERRGQPALHHKFGLPVALNAGNWLYFWPFQLVREMDLSPENELFVYRLYHRTMLRAHFGQALDVGLNIDSLDQGQIPAVCLASMELKTGALTSFALVMGGLLGGASDRLLTLLDEFGHRFGILLQMFDDLGNVQGRRDPAKRYEDLILQRPSWVWACVAENYPKEAFDEFAVAVGRLPDERLLGEWIDRFAFQWTAKRQAENYLEKISAELKTAIGNMDYNKNALQRLIALGATVSKAYE